MPTVLVADDHRLVVSGIIALLERDGRHTVVGTAHSAGEALSLARSLRPDIAILDITMPGGSGLNIVARMATICRVLVMTMHNDTAYVRQAMQQGATGYVLKEAPGDELLRAVELVAKGQVYVYPPLAVELLPIPRARQPDPVTILSKRELQVLRLLSLGYLNREIASELGISVRTVETYRARLNAKLSLASRADLVAYALEHGLI